MYRLAANIGARRKQEAANSTDFHDLEVKSSNGTTQNR